VSRKQVRIMLLRYVIIAISFDACLAQSGTEGAKACAEVGRGLHATLNARAGFAGDLSLETLEFQLMNDSDQTKDSSTESWTLVIDDQDAIDPGGQLWMGPAPGGGYGTVKSGQTFSFGKGLPSKDYFPEARDYKVYWKAAQFRSNTVVVRGGGGLSQ
jgi:hypothetical protein